MAALIERLRRDGTIGFQVRWRQDGRWQSETFDAKRPATRFSCDVEDAGNRWPAGWIPGVGYCAPASEPIKTPFSDFAERYLLTRSAVSDYQLTRYRSEVGRLATHFTWMEDIDDQAVSAWIRAMRAQQRSAKTIANYHGLLFAVCAYAVRKGRLGANPCADTQLPRRSRHDDDGEPITCFLEPAEFDLIAEAMCAVAHYSWRPPGGRGVRRARAQIACTGIGYRQDRDFITLAAHTGLRWGEITALRVGDVDIDNRRLAVRRAWKRDGKGQWIIGPPKTAASRRTLSLAPTLADMLAEHIRDHARDEYVFRNGEGGPIRQPSFHEDRWRRAVDLARTRGLTKRPRFHDLRHTHVAWLVAANTPLPKIQQRLGHESIQTTIDVYGGLLHDTDDQVDTAVEALLQAIPRG